MGHFHIWWKRSKESYNILKEIQITIIYRNRKHNTKHGKTTLTNKHMKKGGVPNEMYGLSTKIHKTKGPIILYLIQRAHTDN
jgi:hypothetical protein